MNDGTTDEAVLAASVEVLLLDLDGTVYAGGVALPGAVDALADCRRRGVDVRFTTNNASRPPQQVVDHLAGMGVRAAVEEVRTSSQAGAQLVRERCGDGVAVLTVGGPGVPQACREAGLVPVTSAQDHPAAVLQGFGPEVGWAQLTEAAFAIRAGALWVATNVDTVLAQERGLALGNGALVAAVRTATGAEPLVAGKPATTLLTAAAEGRSALVVGDRLDTDIRGARACGLPSLFVLSGVDDARALLHAVPAERPDHLGVDLRALGRPAAPAATRDGDVWRSGSAAVRVHDGVAEVDHREDDAAADGADGADGAEGAALDLLRAACAACWSGDGVRPGDEVLARVASLGGR